MYELVTMAIPLVFPKVITPYVKLVTMQQVRIAILHIIPSEHWIERTVLQNEAGSDLRPRMLRANCSTYVTVYIRFP